uniref:Uncharacterized protein n=1 Tax=Kryptolebias marmoratus TaxID=37003 RepID=A0A3Q3ARD0_KRYMA
FQRAITKFLKKLKKRGAKIVTTEDESTETIVFCPIVSRFETDIQSAISSTSKKREVILVAMHHTYDPNYTLPDRRSYDRNSVKLLVECLFFEKKGLYKCPRNSKAKKSVYKQVITHLKLHMSMRTERKINLISYFLLCIVPKCSCYILVACCWFVDM